MGCYTIVGLAAVAALAVIFLWIGWWLFILAVKVVFWGAIIGLVIWGIIKWSDYLDDDENKN